MNGPAALFIIPTLMGPVVTNTPRPQANCEHHPPSLMQCLCQPSGVPATIPMVYGENRIEKQSTQPESHGWQVVAQGSNQARPSSSARVSETAHFCGAGRRITNTGQCKGKHVTDSSLLWALLWD